MMMISSSYSTVFKEVLGHDTMDDNVQCSDDNLSNVSDVAVPANCYRELLLLTSAQYQNNQSQLSVFNNYQVLHLREWFIYYH